MFGDVLRSCATFFFRNKISKPTRRFLLTAIFSTALTLHAQNVVLTGSLSGRVSDPSGAVVPGASVLLRSLATGVEQSATTNHAGVYQFAAVMPGA